MANKGKMAGVAAVEKKLWQAEHHLGLLEEASRTNKFDGRDGVLGAEALESHFSACLNAARSAHKLLQATGGESKEARERWFAQLSASERSHFEEMRGLRNKDAYQGGAKVKPMQKYVEDDPLRNRSPHFPRASFIQNIALFGGEMPVMEYENPDGTKVKGSVFRGAVGLYLDRDGRNVEVTTACREFIGQLRSLLEATKASQK
jgi:hypothetical protein